MNNDKTVEAVKANVLAHISCSCGDCVERGPLSIEQVVDLSIHLAIKAHTKCLMDPSEEVIEAGIPHIMFDETYSTSDRAKYNELRIAFQAMLSEQETT